MQSIETGQSDDEHDQCSDRYYLLSAPHFPDIELLGKAPTSKTIPTDNVQISGNLHIGW